jgi:uncharacterized HhH-GPD family protein
LVVVVTLTLAQDPAADHLLATDPFALLTGMLLDQQFPMERAFTGPYLLADRLGDATRLDPAVIVAAEPDTLASAAQGPPAIHRYPGSMAGRIRALAEVVVTEYGGETARIWTDPGDGRDVLRRLKALPGFGDQKARIFLALVAKQLGVAPDGWREACAPYGDPGTRMSIADVTDTASLEQVRAWKKERKLAAKT